MIVIEKGRTKDSRSVRFAKKVGEQLGTKYEDKYHEKVTRLFGDKFKRKGKNFCPKCGVEIKTIQNRFCSECSIRLKD